MKGAEMSMSKVTLAEMAARLADAQEKAGNFWTLEQPATSLMWLWGAIAELIARLTTYVAIIDVCMYGSPWKKPTTLAASELLTDSPSCASV